MTYKGIPFTLTETAQGWKIEINGELIDGYFPDQAAANTFAKQWIENPPPLLKDLSLGELNHERQA